MIPGWATALLVAALAEAPDPTGAWLLVIRDRGAEGCPDGPALATAVEAQLRFTPFSDRRDAPVRCFIDRDGREWQARIEIAGEGDRPATTRSIRAQGPSCRQLASALELTLTLALAGTPAAPPAEPRPVPQVVDPEVPAALATRATASGGPWSLSGGAVFSNGALLDLAAGMELGIQWRRGRFAVAMEGRGDRALPLRVGAATIDGWRASGAILPCFVPGRAGLLCGVVRAGGFGATSQGLMVSRGRGGVLAEAGARATVQVGRGALALGLYAEGTVPLVRTRLLVDQRAVWESPPVVLSLGLTLLAAR